MKWNGPFKYELPDIAGRVTCKQCTFFYADEHGHFRIQLYMGTNPACPITCVQFINYLAPCQVDYSSIGVYHIQAICLSTKLPRLMLDEK